MELVLLNELGKEIGTFKASDEVFGKEYNEALVHQVVVAYQANMRGGNRAQKDRAQVKHTTKKPWRQKGTGRARAGMSSSPLWRGGGKIFPNSPEENFTQKVNRKMYRAAVKAIYSQLVREGRLCVVENFSLSAPKTKEAASKFKNFGEQNIMFVTDEVTENLYLATRNIHTIDAREARFVDPYSLLKSKKVLLTKEAVAQVEELLG